MVLSEFCRHPILSGIRGDDAIRVKGYHANHMGRVPRTPRLGHVLAAILLALSALLALLASPTSALADDDGDAEEPEPCIVPLGPQLNEAERNFIRSSRVIRVGIDNDWLPFEFLDEHGQHQGISAEYLARLSELVGLEFRPVIQPTWQHTLEAMQRGEIDMLAMAAKTPERSVYAHFTTPYVRSPMVVVTQRDLPFMASLRELPSARVAVVPGYASHDYLVRSHGYLERVPVDTTLQGLKLVASGQVPAMVDNLAAVTDMMIRFGLANLKISGQLTPSFDLSMAVRHDLPELLSILEKGLNAIPEGERVEIYNRWIRFEVDTRPDYRKVTKGGALAAFMLLIMAVYNRRLARYRAELEAANRKLAILSETDTLTGTANRLALQKQLDREMALYRRHHPPVCIALFDLDHFKTVNDTLGHPKGDRVLCEFSRLVELQIREIDSFGRWGGEEFLLICPSTEPGACKSVVERILEATRRHDFGTGFTQTVSAGITAVHADETAAEVLARCDQNLYRAKRSGRNQYRGDLGPSPDA